MDELLRLYGYTVVFGGALLTFLSIYLPCWLAARLGRGYKRWAREQRESAWSIRLIPED